LQLARAHAQRSACSNNLRQIGIALAAYSIDWQETYPYAGGSIAFARCLSPYLPRAGGDVWICPNDPKSDAAYRQTKGDIRYSSFSPSEQFFDNLENDWCQHSPRSAADSPRSKAIMVYEGTDLAWFPAYTASIPDLREEALGIWHEGKGNYLFSDGSVRCLSLKRTLSPVNLWDDISHWSPESASASHGYASETVTAVLTRLEEERYPE
jgi:prepilin-type processing-associated H-X9-DG protein